MSRRCRNGVWLYGYPPSRPCIALSYPSFWSSFLPGLSCPSLIAPCSFTTTFLEFAYRKVLFSCMTVFSKWFRDCRHAETAKRDEIYDSIGLASWKNPRKSKISWKEGAFSWNETAREREREKEREERERERERHKKRNENIKNNMCSISKKNLHLHIYLYIYLC